MCDHDDDVDVLLVDHPPERLDRRLHGTLEERKVQLCSVILLNRGTRAVRFSHMSHRLSNCAKIEVAPKTLLVQCFISHQ